MQLLSVKQLATLLVVSPRTVWRLKNEHRLPKSVKFRGNTRWRLSDIETWIASGCPRVRGVKQEITCNTER